MKVRRLAAVLAAVAAALIVACSSSKPKSAGVTDSSTPVVSSVPTSSPPSLTSAPSTDPAATETADRLAVETAWTKFWNVKTRLMATPTSRLAGAVASVAVDPTRKQMLAAVTIYRSKKLTQYGFVINHPYWQKPIAGKRAAVMGDCLDGSHFGTKSTITGQKRTVGPARDNTKASFVRGSDGVWRVQSIVYLLDVKC